MASPLFDQLYVLGDSLSDSGGIFQLSSQALSLAAADGINTAGLQPIPVSPPYAGKFSNGPVLPEITAELLGAKLFNFSFGGAEALGTLTLEQAAGPAISDQVKAEVAALPPDERTAIDAVLDKNINLPGQVTDFVAETSAHPPSAHSALVILIGLNDLQALEGTFDPSNPQALIGEAAQVTAAIVQADLGAAHTAFSQGIGTVIFETLPAASFFPAGHALSPVLQAIGDAVVDAINVGLKADAVALHQEGHDARIVDLARITDQISADPAAFGFQDLAQPTLLGNGIEFSVNPAAPPPDQTAFFDPLHATTKLHSVLAQFVAASLTSGGPGSIASSVDYSAATGGVYVDLAAQFTEHAPAGLGWSGGPSSVTPLSIDHLSGIQNVVGSSRDDLLVGGTLSGDLSGGGGNDLIYGNTAQTTADNASQLTLDGGAGNNALYGSSGFNTFMAGNAAGGFNQIWGAASKMAAISGFTNNTLSFAATPAGQSVYVDLKGGHNAYLNSGIHNDGSYTLEDSIADVPNVTGSQGGDILIADNGTDRLQGGGGADRLYAGSGFDTFVYAAPADSNLLTGYDTINGFKSGTDKIDLTALHSDASHLLIQTSGTANSVYLETTPGSFNSSTDLALSVNTTAPGGLHASDFNF